MVHAFAEEQPVCSSDDEAISPGSLGRISLTTCSGSWADSGKTRQEHKKTIPIACCLPQITKKDSTISASLAG